MNIIKQIRWKFLLGVFKIKRLTKRFFGVRRLDYQGADIYILTDTIREYETRAKSVQKEPKTVSWIEKWGDPQLVFYDIGANVGAYTLIAAFRGARVIAFESAHQNTYRLYENLFLNNMVDNVTVVPLVLGKKEGVLNFSKRDTSFGATYSFNSSEEVKNVSGQSLLSLQLDTCVHVFSLPIPTMMKIDVDGAELDILLGAQKILKNLTLQHILIETEAKNDREIREMLSENNFQLVDVEDRGRGVKNYFFGRI